MFYVRFFILQNVRIYVKSATNVIKLIFFPQKANLWDLKTFIARQFSRKSPFLINIALYCLKSNYSLASHLWVPVVDILSHTKGTDLDVVLVDTAAQDQGGFHFRSLS